MKPNFALSLSHDGIVLLQRSAAGWRSLGDVNSTSATLSEELAVLRRTATALVPGGLRCKLIIPNDQIRYLTLETPGSDRQARQQSALDALEGATPYAVSELVVDTSEDGDRTHVAAVARETLAEAEAFAVQHRFHPVSFAATPEDGSFLGEPFFGMSESAADLLADGDEVERESSPFAATPETSTDSLVPEEQTAAPGPEPAAETVTPIDPASQPETLVLSEMETGFAAETEDGDAVDPDVSSQQPSFVSRRRVPTFRSEPPPLAAFSGVTEGTVPGFGEPPKGYRKTTAASTHGDADQPAVVPAPLPVVRRPENEVERFTIYGARPTGGMSHRMGGSALLVLASVALLAGFGAFASGMGGNLSSLFERWTASEPVAQFTAPAQPQVPVTTVQQITPEETAPVELAALDGTMTDEDAAVLDALRAVDEETEESPEISRETPGPEDLRAAYAVSGIWPVAPEVPSPPPLVDLDDLYVTSIDPINPNFDAVALPSLDAKTHDASLLPPASPAPAGTRFTLDDRGMVVPTPDGSMNPDGIMVFEGLPPARQPTNLVKSEDPGVDLDERLRLSGFRPRPRPANLIETSERAAFSGLTRSELSQIRPQLRPQSAQQDALATASLVELDEGTGRSLLEQSDEGTSFDSATAQAIVASLRPDARPKNFEKTVAKAAEQAPAPVAASATQVAPRVVRPNIPSSASASRAATTKNAINLRKVNLIGVYGKPSSRRALVRLENGRYRKVQVGDRIDGGRVSAIGDAELRYQKSGRAIVLKMPRG